MIERPYAADLGSLFQQLESAQNGLSDAEARQRLQRFGLNEIPEKDRRTGFSILLSQFKSPLILILIAASIIAGFLGEQLDAAIIIGIILLNTLLGFYQEFKSEHTLAELKKYISFMAKVLRNKEEIEVNAKELVPGDIVFLEIGDSVPADIRLIEAEELTVNESALTGESFPVSKKPGIVAMQDALPAQQSNVVFMGTSIASGSCKGIVFATGENTQFSKTATILSAKEPPTDFQKSINNFGNFLLKIIFLLTIFVFASNALLGKDILSSFLFALALAVGITPELLPIIITIGLSTGALHLAKKNVVVKRLIAIEGLGNIDTLCIDKTGTITENKVSLIDYFDPDGKKSRQLLEFALICNSAIVEKGEAKGNIIDAAIWDYANKEEKVQPPAFKKIEEIEFDYERRKMSVVIEKNGERMLICKGAPESVISSCAMVKKEGRLLPIKKFEQELLQKFNELSQSGNRVVALAFKKIGQKKDYTQADEQGLVFAGFFAFLDPPKKTAIEALKSFSYLGVELKILTGDNELVTAEVCREVGLEIKNRVISGMELEKMGEEQFAKTIEESNVFARITPEQKFKIVSALTKQGHIVGFLGDGVNDAPALKAADVGITVDSAVDVAKDSADIILLQKSLLVLADGIKEGRKTFGNITKYIFNTISANFGNMFTLAISSLFLKFIPLLPSQVLLTNFISDAPLMTISTDNVDEEYLHKPKRWSIKTISRFMIYFGAISAIFDLLTIAILMLIVNAQEATFQTVWFLESVLSEIIVTFSIRTKRSLWRSKPSRMLLLTSIAAMALSVGIIYSPLAFLFKFEQLSTMLLVTVAVILFEYFALVEVAKKRFYKKHEI